MLAKLPNLSAEPLRTSLFEVVNDQHLNLYVASLVRAVTSLHDLVENKKRVGSLLDEGDGKDKDKEKEKEKEKAAAASAKKGGEGGGEKKDEAPATGGDEKKDGAGKR